MTRVSAAMWWATVTSEFETLKEFLTKAKKADLAEMGHDCGHQFEITVDVIGHAGIAGEGPSSHRDAQRSTYDALRTVTVRAHNLRDALLVAATVPLSEWLEKDEDEEKL